MSQPSEFDLPDDLKDLERELANLQPEALDPVAHGRLSSAILHAKSEPEDEDSETGEIETPATHKKVVLFTSTLAAAAAAVLVLLGISLSDQQSAVSTPETSIAQAPVENTSPVPANAAELATSSELVEIVDEGIILTETSQRMRQLRTIYTDTVSWVDPSTDARTRLSYQREELFLIPIDAI